MKIILYISITVAIAVITVSNIAMASVVEKETEVLVAFLSGNISLAIGLLAGTIGFYTWFVQQQNWGLMMIILGAILTAFPGVFEGMYNTANAIIKPTGTDRANIDKW